MNATTENATTENASTENVTTDNATTGFLPAQQLVLDLIAGGHNVSSSAAHAGVHRNTVANWARVSDDYRDALQQAHYDQAMHVRDQMIALIPAAIQTLHAVMNDDRTPPGIRLRASLAIIQQASAPPLIAPQPRSRAQSAQLNTDDVIASLHHLSDQLDITYTRHDPFENPPHAPLVPPLAPPENSAQVHNAAQSLPITPQPAPNAAPVPAPASPSITLPATPPSQPAKSAHTAQSAQTAGSTLPLLPTNATIRDLHHLLSELLAMQP